MSLYEEIKRLRKSGKLQEAYNMVKKLLPEYKEDVDFAREYGWVLYDIIKETVNKVKNERIKKGKDAKKYDNNNHITKDIYGFLREYADLPLKRPDLLFSLILMQLLRISERLYFFPQFLLWAKTDSFRKEDYELGDFGEYDSLIARAAMENSAIILDSPEKYERAVVNYAFELIEHAQMNAKVKDSDNLLYKKSRLLILTERFEEAEELLFHLARKREEYWLFERIGDCKTKKDEKKALLFYAKAILLCRDEKMGVNLYEKFARLTSLCNETAIAKWSLEKAISVRKRNDFTLPKSLLSLMNEDWFLQASSVPKNQAEIKKKLEEMTAPVEAELYPANCRKEATFLGTSSIKGKLHVKIALNQGDLCRVYFFPTVTDFQASSFEYGAPVDVFLFSEQENQIKDGSRITSISPRLSGAPFDNLCEAFGIISQQNAEKNHAWVYFSHGDFPGGALSYRSFQDAKNLQIGTYVKTRYYTEFDTGSYKVKICHFEKTDYIPDDRVRIVSGIVDKHPDGYGFIEDKNLEESVYIPYQIAEKCTNNTVEKFIAIIDFNKKRRQYSWKAIKNL